MVVVGDGGWVVVLVGGSCWWWLVVVVGGGLSPHGCVGIWCCQDGPGRKVKTQLGEQSQMEREGAMSPKRGGSAKQYQGPHFNADEA